jgi:hypothetical protein
MIYSKKYMEKYKKNDTYNKKKYENNDVILKL